MATPNMQCSAYTERSLLWQRNKPRILLKSQHYTVVYPKMMGVTAKATVYPIKRQSSLNMPRRTDTFILSFSWMTEYQGQPLLGLDSDTFYIYHVAAVMVDNLRRLLLGINLSDKAIMDFDFPGVGFPV